MSSIFTIGFTKTTAEVFISRLLDARVRTVIDTRANRDGQLSGFAKSVDLRYFLRELADIEYRIADVLAPHTELLKDYKARRIGWATYAYEYREGLDRANAHAQFAPSDLDGACLLCSEHTAERCHRSIAAAYLQERVAPALEIVHL